MPKRPRAQNASDDKSEDYQGLTALHRSRLVDWRPVPVTAIAPCGEGTVVAVGYENATIELWDTTSFSCFLRIPGEEGAELTSLAWVLDPTSRQHRLFAALLDGQVLEVDFQKLRPKAAADCYGGAAWCLAAEPHEQLQPGDTVRLAVGCDDGSIRMFTVDSDALGPQYQRALCKIEGRVLALHWDPTGASLFSGGSDGCIHRWDARNGRQLQRLTVAATSSRPVCVWTLAGLPDGTLVSGDSDGAVQFWDTCSAGTGTLRQRLQQHAGDVLAVAAAPDGSAVFAAGIDPTVTIMGHVKSSRPEAAATADAEWAYLDCKRPHTHDVRALAVVARSGEDPLLLSGGNDGQLICYSVPRVLKQHPTRLTKAPQRPVIVLAPAGGAGSGAASRYMLAMQHNVLDLYKLGAHAAQGRRLHPSGAASDLAAATAAAAAAAATTLQEADPLDLIEAPSHLVRIKSSGRKHLACAAVSRGAAYVACSDSSKLRAFALDLPAATAATSAVSAGSPSVQRLPLESALEPAVCMTFGTSEHNDDSLYYATAWGDIHSLNVKAGAVEHSTSVHRNQQDRTQLQQQPSGGSSPSALNDCAPMVSHMLSSPDGKLLAVACRSAAAAAAGDGSSTVGVQLYQLPDLQVRGRLTPPAGASPAAHIAAMAFTADGAQLAFLTSANALAVYDTATLLPTEWSRQHAANATKHLDKLPGSVVGMSFSNGSQPANSVIIHTAGGFCNISLGAPVLSEHIIKRSRRGALPPPSANTGTATLPGVNGRLFVLPDPVLAMGWVDAHTALLVEKPWEEVLALLPPPLYRHRYGA